MRSRSVVTGFCIFGPMQISELSAHYAKKFQRTLIHWSEENPRPMPWKESKNPYFIWLSEIILQQTRVQQGWDYYLRFKEAFPTVQDLANAEEGEVLNLWQGLGYYSRARNLHATAKIVAQEMDGVFPTEPKGLLTLKGVGPYTAAAIASFAFNYPAAVVDGNVYRVFSRLFGIETPIDSTEGKKKFQALADRLLAKKDPARYNQALIDFGATQCKPKKPLCASCPFHTNCFAFHQELIDRFPIKSKSIKRKDRFFNYLVLKSGNEYLFNHRQEKDIWKGLYDFPLWESENLVSGAKIKRQFEQQGLISKNITATLSPPQKQILSHQTIYAQFYQLEVEKQQVDNATAYLWVPVEKLKSYAFPRIIDLFLADKDLYLNLQ